MGLPRDTAPSMSEAEAIVTFHSQRAKDAAIQELLGLAYADDSFMPEEHEVIPCIAAGFSDSGSRL